MNMYLITTFLYLCILSQFLTPFGIFKISDGAFFYLVYFRAVFDVAVYAPFFFYLETRKDVLPLFQSIQLYKYVFRQSERDLLQKSMFICSE